MQAQRLITLTSAGVLGVCLLILIAAFAAGYLFGCSNAKEDGARSALLLSGRVELLRHLGVLDALLRKDFETAESRVKASTKTVIRELSEASIHASALEKEQTDDVLDKAKQYAEALR